MQRLMRAAIGTNNIDNCSRVCHSPTSFALRKSFGLSGATGSFTDFDHADATILIGANPTEGHPVVGARIKQATLRGMKLVTIDPRRIELADYGVLHLSPRPGHQRRRDARHRARDPPRRLRRTPTSSTRARAATRRCSSCCRSTRPRSSRRSPASPPPTSIRPPTSTARPRTPASRWGLGRDRAQVRLRGRPADLQRRADDRQRRPATASRCCRCAARTTSRARPTWARCRTPTPPTAPSATRTSRGSSRSAWGVDDPAREGLHDPADVRRGGRRRPEGDVHLRRGRRADRPEHRARRRRAGEPRVHGLPGHLRDRDDQVRGRDPARVVLPREDGHVHQRRAADPARRTRRSSRPAAPRPTSRSSRTSRARSATSCGWDEPEDAMRRGRRADARTSPASPTSGIGRRGLQWPVAPDGTDAPILYEHEFDLPGGRGALRRAALQGAGRRRRRGVPADPRHRPPPAALQRGHDDPPHRQPRAQRPRLPRDPPRRRRRGCGSTTATRSRSAAARAGSRSGAGHRPDRARPRLHHVPLPGDAHEPADRLLGATSTPPARSTR